MEADILQNPLGALGAVFEIHMVEINGAVGGVGVFIGPLAGDGGDLAQHLRHPLGAGRGAGQHHEDHGNHHEGHHDLGDVGEVGDELSGLQGTGVDHLTAEPHDGDDGPVDNQHHQGHVDDHPAEGPEGGVFQIVVALRELLPLPVLPDEGLYHPDARQVLLDHQVQRVGLLLEGAEQGPCRRQQDDHHHRQQGQRRQENAAEPVADADGEEQGGHQHYRGPDHQAHGHHQGHLEVVHVVGQPGHQGGGGKALDVGKGEGLDVVELCPAEVRPEAHARHGGRHRRPQAEAQGGHRQGHHQPALAQNVGLVGICDAHVHDVAHHQGDQQLEDGLHGAARHTRQNPRGVGPGVGPELFRHVSDSSLRF